jgi:enoyl-CoA hydratase/carnithine racemase
MSQEEPVLVERDGHVTIVTLNRPARLNALNREAGDRLGAIFAEFEADRDQRVAILTGAGRAFCTGNDLGDMSTGGEAPTARTRRPGAHGHGWASLTKRFPLHKPVVAAINGFAMAGGLELALVCDIRIAAQSARLGCTEVRWALMPTGGGTQRLPRAIPEAWANYMVLTGEDMTAEQAGRIGLVSHVFPDADLMGEARRIAGVIASRGPLAVWAAKEAMLRGRDLPLEQGLALEDMLGLQVFQTRDVQEGLAAFQQKRPPRYTGD